MFVIKLSTVSCWIFCHFTKLNSMYFACRKDEIADINVLLWLTQQDRKRESLTMLSLTTEMQKPNPLFLEFLVVKRSVNEPPHDKTNKMTRAPREDSDQPGHPPSLIWSRVFAVRMKKHFALNYLLSAQWRLWSDWAVLSWGNSRCGYCTACNS